MKNISDKIVSVLLGIIVFVSLILSFIIFVNNSNLCDILTGSGDINTLASKGDFFGGYLGTILSTITVLLVYITFLYQKRELKEQREGFELTRSFDLIYKEFDLLENATSMFLGNQIFKQKIDHYENRIRTLTIIEDNIKNSEELDSTKMNNFRSIYVELIYRTSPFAIKVSSIFEMFQFLTKPIDSRNVLFPIIYKKIDLEMITFFITSISLVSLVERNKKHIEEYNDEQIIDLRIALNKILDIYSTPPAQH